MQIEITVQNEGRPVDVAVVAPPGAASAEVLAAVEHRCAGGRPLVRAAGSGPELCRGEVLVDAGAVTAQPVRHGLLELRVVGGPSAGSTVPLDRSAVTIGRHSDCDLALDDPEVSSVHAVVEVADAVIVRDADSTNGTRLDGRDLVGAARVSHGSVLEIGDARLVFAAPDDRPAELGPVLAGRRRVHRPPRSGDAVAGAQIRLPDAPTTSSPIRRHLGWPAIAVPAVAGAGLAYWVGSAQFLLFALLSPLTVAVTAVTDRLSERRRRTAAARRHAASLAEARREIATALAAESSARHVRAPDPATVARIAALPSTRLWGRAPVDRGDLHVRLGLGDQPSAAMLVRGPHSEPAGLLPGVPVECALDGGPLGLAGPEAVIERLSWWIVGQLAVHYSPSDVELAFLVAPQRAERWAWARWLPHFCGRIARTRAEAERLDLSASRTGKWLVVVVDPAESFDHPRSFRNRSDEVGDRRTTALFVDTRPDRLPRTCTTIVRAEGDVGSRLVVEQPSVASSTAVLADLPPPAWAESLARSLAALTDARREERGVPDACTLGSAHGLGRPVGDAVPDSWSDRHRIERRAGLRACLGIGLDGPVWVDLAADGPHALVAGTTGSGKSELLRSLVGSLALRYPPEDLNFLLVDYKGGAAFAECAPLPHVTAVVTDLDRGSTERALRSMQAELLRRERLFAAASVVDLDGYRARDRDCALARLVVVVDEFATLAEDLPDFLRGLVSVAQRGRSLGVHLVLATQRPGSAVSPDIRANTSIRICLRVTDSAESLDVLGSAAAAHLDARRPGRAYLRTGSALTCFQAARASATSLRADEIRIEPLGPWLSRAAADADSAESDLASVVAAAVLTAERTGRSRAQPLWQPPLPELLPRSELDASATPTTVRFGRVDLPHRLATEPLELDLGRSESMLVIGGQRSGRTEALASVAVGVAGQLPPERLALYLIDPVGDLVDRIGSLPHLSTVLSGRAVDRLPRLLSLIRRDLADRAASPDGVSLLLVDGWDRLLASLPEAAAAECTDELTHLVRVGGGGPSVVVSADPSAVSARVSAMFGSTVLLRPAQRRDFAVTGIPPASVAESWPPGRGVRSADGALLQIALAARADAEEALPRPSAVSGIVLRSLPDRVSLSGVRPSEAGRFVLGVGGDRAEVLDLDLFAADAQMLVAGPPRSGRTTLLAALAEQAAARPLELVVAAPRHSPLVEIARRLGALHVAPEGFDRDQLPAGPTVLLVDDCETFADRPSGDHLTEWLGEPTAPVSVVTAGRNDAFATAYRGLTARARHAGCTVVLRPAPVDGELLGVRLPRWLCGGPPGRGVVVARRDRHPLFAAGEAVAVQVVQP